MGYDLTFRSRGSGEAPPIEDLHEYFEHRRNFRIDGFTAQYLNEDTGIYFSFDMGGDYPMFQLNYARSRVFALEAVGEVRSFVQHFDQTLDDPHIDGMAGGEFSEEKFLAGFDTGNRLGYRQAADPATGFEGWFTRPAAAIAAEWRWNFERGAMQERVGESVFVPKISYFLMEGALRSGAVWSDAIPVAMPAVEHLVIVRDRAWPKRILNPEPEILAVPFARLQPIASQYRLVPGDLAHYQMYWDKPPSDVVEFLRGAPSNETPFEAVSADRILDEETMADVCALAGLHHKLK
jgi:hypothetical protein